MDRIKAFPVLANYVDSTSRWFHKSYLLDWTLAVVLFVIVQAVTMFVSPFHRYLPPNDPSVLYPKVDDIVSDALLMILSIVVPIMLFALFQIYLKNGQDCHHALLGLIVSISLTNVVTASIKSAAGRYRPNWFASYGGDMDEGRFSFPSGHSSNSFAGMVFLSLYLMGKFRIFGNHKQVGSLWRSLIALLPLTVAFFIAVSRTVDYHHNFSDILAGSLIGTGFSFFSYFMYFPSLFDADCHLPKVHPLSQQALTPLQLVVVEDFKKPANMNKAAMEQEAEGSPRREM